MTRTRTTFTPVTFALFCLTALPAFAQNYTLKTLAQFNGAGTGLTTPESSVTVSGSKLYGTAYGGGASGDGGVYSVPTGGGTLATLAAFDGVGNNGADPEAGLTTKGTLLYGTTFDGGSGGVGAVYSLDTTTSTVSSVASFNNNAGFYPNGANPSAGLTLSGTTLYGTASAGGSDGAGTVFSVNTANGTLALVANFTSSNGATPNANLTAGANNTLYGTTFYGGANGEGTVFALNTLSSTITTLSSFTGTGGLYPHGQNPYAGLTLVGTTLYGTTEFGGVQSDGITSGEGTVFAINTVNGTLTTLATFTGANGAYPLSGLTAVGSILFGTTQDGGAGGDGTVFALNTTSGTLTTIASFTGPNGSTPLANLTLGAGGILYGTTSGGGNLNGDGTVFSLTPSPEPASWVIITIGVGSLLLLGGRRRLTHL